MVIRSDSINILFLAAGEGTRLRPLTIERPKPLLEVNGEQILQRLLRQFGHVFEGSTLWVNISYKAEVFLASFGNLNIENSPRLIWETEPLGSALTVKSLMEIVNSPLLVVHSDLVLSDDYVVEVRKTLEEARFRKNILFCHKRIAGEARSTVSIDGQFKVIAFQQGELGLVNQNHLVNVNSGIYFFCSWRNRGLNAAIGTEITNYQIPLLINEESLMAKLNNKARVSVDSLESLEKARQFFREESHT